MAYADRYLTELEGKRKSALGAVAAYAAALAVGKKVFESPIDKAILDKVNILAPTMSKFESVIGISKI